MRYGLLLCLLVVGLIMTARTDAGPAPQQDVIRLDARVSQLEQRLYTIETSLRTLEQQSRIAGMSQRGAGITQDDLALLRSEIQTLQVRIMEDECGLAKLDERTLSPMRREERRKSAVGNDPCRTNFEVPLRLRDR